VLERFKHNNVIEIRNGIMFDFYLGLPRVHVKEKKQTCSATEDINWKSSTVNSAKQFQITSTLKALIMYFNVY